MGIITDIRVVSENQIRPVSNMFLQNSDTDHFTDLIQAFWAIDPFSDPYTFGCVQGQQYQIRIGSDRLIPIRL